MPSDRFCCVPGCKNSRDKHGVLHKFPNPEKDRVRFNTWLYSIGGDILGLENAHIFKHRRVCSLHFQDKYMCRNNRLSNIAVPTLNLPGLNLITVRKPLRGLENLPMPSTSTAPESLQQLMYVTSTNLTEETIVEESIGRKVSVRTLGLSSAERKFQHQLMTAKRKINKLKNKVRKQMAEIKAAKKKTKKRLKGADSHFKKKLLHFLF